MIRQGDVYWLHFGKPSGSAPAGRRPALVVQHERFNQSGISTIVVAAITSNLRLAAMPGNLRLRKREAGLPKASVVNISQLRTVDRNHLSEPIGRLSDPRLEEVLKGLALLLGTEGIVLELDALS